MTGEHLPAPVRRLFFPGLMTSWYWTLRWGGYQPASQNPFPLFWFAGPWQEGGGFGSVCCFQRRCVPWAFPHQLASFNIRQAECYTVGACRAKSPVLEYRARNEVTEGKGKGRAQTVSSLVLGVPSLGTGGGCSWTLWGWGFPQVLKSAPMPFIFLNQQLPYIPFLLLLFLICILTLAFRCKGEE